MDEKEVLYEDLQTKFRAQQLEKNAERLRTHHPAYRRHQREIEAEIKKVNTFFEETILDQYTVRMLETMLHFKAEGHSVHIFDEVHDDGAVEATKFLIYRKAETSEVRLARIKAYHDKEKAKHPVEDEDDDYE